MFFFFVMRHPPRTTRTDTHFPDTTPFRSPHRKGRSDRANPRPARRDDKGPLLVPGDLEPGFPLHDPHMASRIVQLDVDGAGGVDRGDRTVRERHPPDRPEEPTSEPQSLMRSAYAVVCSQKKITYRLRHLINP